MKSYVFIVALKNNKSVLALRFLSLLSMVALSAIVAINLGVTGKCQYGDGHTDSHTHTYIHTYIHTHTYTHIVSYPAGDRLGTRLIHTEDDY